MLLNSESVYRIDVTKSFGEERRQGRKSLQGGRDALAKRRSCLSVVDYGRVSKILLKKPDKY